MTILAPADPGDSIGFDCDYQPPAVDEIDPSFIHMNPAVMERSDFDVPDRYYETVEPRVIDEFDYRAQAARTVEQAEQFIETIRTKLDKHESTYERIFQIMRSKRFRAGTVAATSFDDNKPLFEPMVQSHIDDGSPIEFVLPSYPFKHKNPAKVGRRSPDMAEVLCLCRLYEICHAIKLVYPPGARFVIISDGLVYRGMFGVTRHETVSYRERVKEMIKQLGFDDALDVVDMDDLVDSRRGQFDVVERRLRPVFAQWWRTNRDDLRRASLISASAANINTAESVTHDLVQLATRDAVLGTDGEDMLEHVEAVRTKTAERADRAAFEFALFLYVLKEIDLVPSCFPRAVRATVHPKPGQWGLHLVNRETRVFPWQGVACRKPDGRWRIRYEFEMMRERATPVHVRGDDDMFPFYYEQSDERAVR